MQSVPTCYILKSPLLRAQITFTWTLLGTEHNYKKNTATFGNNSFLLAQIFDILKIWQNLLIAFQTLKVLMSSALTFRFMTTELLIIPWVFSCDTKRIYLLTSICDKLLGSKCRVFVKLSHVKLLLGKNFLTGHKLRHPIPAQLLLSYKSILRIETFLWASDNFFDSL